MQTETVVGDYIRIHFPEPVMAASEVSSLKLSQKRAAILRALTLYMMPLNFRIRLAWLTGMELLKRLRIAAGQHVVVIKFSISI